jgi:hypothetical protein
VLPLEVSDGQDRTTDQVMVTALKDSPHGPQGEYEQRHFYHPNDVLLPTVTAATHSGGVTQHHYTLRLQKRTDEGFSVDLYVTWLPGNPNRPAAGNVVPPVQGLMTADAGEWRGYPYRENIRIPHFLEVDGPTIARSSS